MTEYAKSEKLALSRRRDSMLVALWIALDNGLHIPPIAWVLFGLEVVGRLLNWWLKED